MQGDQQAMNSNQMKQLARQKRDINPMDFKVAELQQAISVVRGQQWCKRKVEKLHGLHGDVQYGTWRRIALRQRTQ